MATYTEEMQAIWRKYTEAGEEWPATAHQVAAFAIQRGLWAPPSADVIALCAEDLARAAREEYHIDARGRKVRSKHVARMRQDGRQINLWADLRTAPRAHMENAFQLRRKQIVGDCKQLSTDVDSYNDDHPAAPPIPVLFDFTDDLADLG